jgi:hypothetical protein
VQLRLTTQAGELKVAVHAASPDLNQGLRDSLSDLTKKLSDSGFHAETWRPGVAATAAPVESDATRNQSQSGSDTDKGDQQSQSRQQSRDDRDDNQSRRPKWAEEFDNSTHQGALNGIRSQLNQQFSRHHFNALRRRHVGPFGAYREHVSQPACRADSESGSAQPK